jgi:RNA12 protein
LKGVSSSHRIEIQHQIKYHTDLEEQQIQKAHKRQAIIDGTWHDGRLDCVAGNGIMSELGVGDECFEIANSIKTMSSEEEEAMIAENEKAFRKQKAQNSTDITSSLPIVVIKNYTANFGSPTKEALLEALAQWAATLIENQVNK